MGCRSRCGFCTFGGPYGTRRSTLTTFRAASAPRIASLHTPRIEVGDGSGPISEAALDRFTGEVLARGIRENAIALFSAHPLGSARAGTDPRTSTFRPTGELHGVDGLWVADGSLRPTAPGANPMISLLAVAVLTAEALLARWGGPTAG